MKKRAILTGMLFAFIFQVSFLNIAYAGDEIDITEIPARFGDMLGTTEFVGGLIASAIFLCMFLFPAMFLARGRTSQTYVILFLGITVLGICVALTWLPVFIFFVLCLLIGLLFAGKIRTFIGG